jgi:hypothetical protein
MVERDVLIRAVQQLEDIFSNLRTNERAWLNIFGLGANDVIRGVSVIPATGTVFK